MLIKNILVDYNKLKREIKNSNIIFILILKIFLKIDKIIINYLIVFFKKLKISYLYILKLKFLYNLSNILTLIN